MFKKAKKGFTIVELVIVIAVIGILSGILIPTFSNLTQEAERSALKSNLSNSYAEYALEATDEKVGDTTYKIKLFSQDKVFLVKAEDAADTGNLQAYGYVDNAWSATPVTITVANTASNYFFVAEGAGSAGQKANSTFGAFVFYYQVA